MHTVHLPPSVYGTNHTNPMSKCVLTVVCVVCLELFSYRAAGTVFSTARSRSNSFGIPYPYGMAPHAVHMSHLRPSGTSVQAHTTFLSHLQNPNNVCSAATRETSYFDVLKGSVSARLGNQLIPHEFSGSQIHRLFISLFSFQLYISTLKGF